MVSFQFRSLTRGYPLKGSLTTHVHGCQLALRIPLLDCNKYENVVVHVSDFYNI